MAPAHALCSGPAWDGGGDGGALCEDGAVGHGVVGLLARGLGPWGAADAGFAAERGEEAALHGGGSGCEGWVWEDDAAVWRGWG